MTDLAERTGADVTAVDDSWITDGPNFGSGNVVRVNKPNVALLWDEPTSSYSAGNTRFVIERQFDYPVTAIRTSRLGRVDLNEYEVLILPATRGDYAETLGESGVKNLRDWVSKGGVLIGLGSASAFLADPDVDLIASRLENAVASDEEQSPAGTNEEEASRVAGSLLTSEEDYRASIKPVDAAPDSLSGVLLKATVTAEHWLGAGVAPTINVLARGDEIYTPLRLDQGVNVARFAAADELMTSGFMWPENQDQMAYKPFAAVQPNGAGFVIAFTQDPTVRAYLDGLNVIFMNAIFRGAAHARPLH